MLNMLRDLILHKIWANESLLKAIGEHENARNDPELWKALHHIIVANRFWLFLSAGIPFEEQEESQIAESLEAIEARYRETHTKELEWMSAVTEADLDRRLESPLIPDFSCSVEQALIQICMHSQGHRVQCAAMLRQMGGVPPQTDFIRWVRERPSKDQG